MSETTGQGVPSIEYQAAQPVFTQASQRSQTRGELHCSRTTAVSRTGQTVHMRVVPRPPRQSGDEARTD